MVKHVDRSAEWNQYLLCRLLRIGGTWLSGRTTLTDPPNGISLGSGVDKMLVSKYARTRFTDVP